MHAESAPNQKPIQFVLFCNLCSLHHRVYTPLTSYILRNHSTVSYLLIYTCTIDVIF